MQEGGGERERETEGERVHTYTCYIQIYWQTCILQLLVGAPQMLDLVLELADELEELQRA
jgi:hypothetical protein